MRAFSFQKAPRVSDGLHRCASVPFASCPGRTRPLVLASASAPPPPPSAPPPAQRKLPPRPVARPGPPIMLGPDGKPLEVVAVEKAGEEAWAGVAGIDKGEDASAMTPSDIALLAAGDAAALLLFAAVGRVNHGEPLNAETFTTALPFVVGLLATSPFLGGFSKAASKAGAGDAALTAAKCWAVGVPAGIVLRSIGRGYWPANSFIIATMAATGVFLIGWRTAYAALTKKEEEPPKSASAQVAARKDKKGNPFEFVQLLMSLTKRW